MKNLEKCMCTNCGKVFEFDEDLEILCDDGEFYKGCDVCKTDGYLMDVEE